MAWQGAVGVRTLERATGGWCQWGALRTTSLPCRTPSVSIPVLHLQTCYWETPYRPPYPTPPLTPPVPSASPSTEHCDLCEPLLACMLREYSSRPFACCAFC